MARPSTFTIRCAAVTVLSGAAALAGCASEYRVVTLDSMTPVGYCAGQYRCSAGGRSVDATFSRASGACYLGEARLDADGAVNMRDGSHGVWTGSASRFEMCFGDGCIACKVTSPQSAPPSSTSTSGGAPRCTGKASACDTFGGEACRAPRGSGDLVKADCPCRAQRGCGAQVEYTSTIYASYDTLYCTGTPEPCGSFDSPEACAAQRGCTWSPS